MKAAITMAAMTALALGACRSDVEPETAETPENETMAVPDTQPASEATPEDGSTYTKIDKCEIVEQSDEEMPYIKRRCDGHAGYDLLISTSDLRDSVTLVTPEGEEQDLDFNRQIANGAFNNLGKTVEWRGENSEKPRVLIARMNVSNAEDPMAADTSFLAVVKLADPACIIARVPPGPGQNVAARRLADRDSLPECLAAEASPDAEAGDADG